MNMPSSLQPEILSADYDLTDLYWKFLDIDQYGVQRIRLLPAAEYKGIDHTAFRLWCNKTARYGIPTTELVDWIRDRIAGRTALEIGAGNGNLGYHLGIDSTDSDLQSKPQVAAFYAALRQPTIVLPPEVVVEEANEAVSKRKPKVVIASWVTHKYDGGAVGNEYGPNEEEIVNQVESYIFIGNATVHGSKPIMKLPQKEFRFPWVVSRSKYPNENAVWVWGK